MWPFFSRTHCEEAAAEEAVAEDTPAEEPASEEVAEEEAPEEPAKPVIELKTAPFDPRFPTTNQAKNCFTRYNEFHKCAKEKGEDAEQCQAYARYYRSICPTEWVDKWNEQRENGNWAGRY